MASKKGAMILDADKIVHEILESNDEVKEAVLATFGSRLRQDDGTINRQLLGDIVFADPESLQSLEEIIHPAVQSEVVRQIDDSYETIVMIEAIKLLEGELINHCNTVWVTRCRKERQIDRLVICRGMDTKSALQRVEAQPSQDAKVSRADVVIDTNSTLADTEGQFEMAWMRLPKPAVAPIRRKPKPPAPKPVAQAAPAAESKAAEPKKGKAAEPEVVRTTEKVAADATPTPVPEAAETPPELPDNVSARRARPGDIPSILLLIHKATDGRVKMKRAQLLMALSERSYLIGQEGTTVSAVIGWATEGGIARVEEVFLHPLDAARTTGGAVMKEVERSAKELFCEAILAFPALDAPTEVYQMFADYGYAKTDDINDLPRVWKTAIKESQPEGTQLLLKGLRYDRIA